MNGFVYQEIFWLFLVGSVLGVVVEGCWCRFRYGRWRTHVVALWGPFNIVYGIGIAVFYLGESLLQQKAWPVRVAALEMELVFLNVLKNARDAAAKSVRIRVEFPAQEAGVVTISFVDDGPDADEKTLERLSASASSQKPEGLGLGLGIARSIVEQHAGKIFFKTNSPDAGLTVVVLLPLMREAL